MADEFKYAVWYETTNFFDDIEIFDDELKAARFAADHVHHSDGDVYGVKRSDGAIEPTSTWPAFLELKAENDRKFREEMELVKINPRQLVDIVNPFTGRHIKCEVDEYPDWVGGLSG